MSIGEIISAQGMTQSDGGESFRHPPGRVQMGDRGDDPGRGHVQTPRSRARCASHSAPGDAPEPCCQSCGLPLGKETDYGAEADGTQSEEYCPWCYFDGSFTGEESLDAFIEHSAPDKAKAAGLSEDEAVSYQAGVLPTLGRWADPDGRARQGAR